MLSFYKSSWERARIKQLWDFNQTNLPKYLCYSSYHHILISIKTDYNFEALLQWSLNKLSEIDGKYFDRIQVSTNSSEIMNLLHINRVLHLFWSNIMVSSNYSQFYILITDIYQILSLQTRVITIGCSSQWTEISSYHRQNSSLLTLSYQFSTIIA